METWKRFASGLLLPAVIVATGCDRGPSPGEQKQRAAAVVGQMENYMSELYEAAPFIKKVYNIDILPELDDLKNRARVANPGDVFRISTDEASQLRNKYYSYYKIGSAYIYTNVSGECENGVANASYAHISSNVNSGGFVTSSLHNIKFFMNEQMYVPDSQITLSLGFRSPTCCGHYGTIKTSEGPAQLEFPEASCTSKPVRMSGFIEYIEIVVEAGGAGGPGAAMSAPSDIRGLAPSVTLTGKIVTKR